MIVADITEGDVLVPHSREIFETDLGKLILSTLYSIASTVSPEMPAFNTVEMGKWSSYLIGANLWIFFIIESPIRIAVNPSWLELISSISCFFAFLNFGASVSALYLDIEEDKLWLKQQRTGAGGEMEFEKK